MLRGFTYIKTGTEYKITQKVSSTNKNLSHQRVKQVIINSMLSIFINSEKMPRGGITTDSSAVLCR